MSRRHRNAHPCPTPTKIPFGTEGAALEAIVRINAESEPARQMPMRAYRCACASWHMTSRSMSYDDIAAQMAAAEQCAPASPKCIGSERGGACSCGEVLGAW